MDILNTATQWAKAEMFSSKFFILAALVFFALSIGFWQLGKSELAKAYITPTAICGALILIIGIGANTTRLLTPYRKTELTPSEEEESLVAFASESNKA